MDKTQTRRRRTRSRRSFLKSTGSVAVGASLAARAYAVEDNTIRLALVGSGGRGSGAVANAFKAPGGPVKLVAMASNFQFCPNIDSMDYDTPAPVKADAQGRYPVPVPGKWSEI